jgi:hypothetical protein
VATKEGKVVAAINRAGSKSMCDGKEFARRDNTVAKARSVNMGGGSANKKRVACLVVLIYVLADGTMEYDTFFFA